MTNGYGPESFTAQKAQAGVYKVMVNYFGTGRTAEHPRLCQASTPAFGHFHLAWKQSAGLGSGSEIRYAHDLTGEGGAGWLMDAPLLLPPPDPFDDVTEPAISCELDTDPDPVSGTVTNDRSAPSVAFMQGLRTVGVLSVVKHFPGIGSSTQNTDYGPAATRPLSELRASALKPFIAAIPSTRNVRATTLPMPTSALTNVCDTSTAREAPEP